MTDNVGCITSLQTAPISPIYSPVSDPVWSSFQLSQSPTPSVPRMPTGNPVQWTDENILIGLCPSRQGNNWDDYPVPLPSPTPSWLDVNISDVLERSAEIAEKLVLNDSTETSVHCVEPVSEIKPLPARDTCSTVSGISKGRLSPRSRLKMWNSTATKNLESSSGLAFQETEALPQSSKMTHKNAKVTFGQLLTNLGIVNSQEYEMHLRESKELRELEKMLQPAHVEGMKKIVFRQNYLLRSETYAVKFRKIAMNASGQSVSLKGGWLRFLDKIASRNGMSRDGLMLALRRWVRNENGKRKGLILIGRSDSGKTFLADCLLSG